MYSKPLLGVYTDRKNEKPVCYGMQNREMVGFPQHVVISQVVLTCIYIYTHIHIHNVCMYTHTQINRYLGRQTGRREDKQMQINKVGI